MRMGRIGGFEACTFVVVVVVGNRIGPLRGFVGWGGGEGVWFGWLPVWCVCVCVCVLLGASEGCGEQIVERFLRLTS